MIFIVQIILYLIFFTASIKLLVLDDPVRGIFFYPKQIQQRVFEMGLATKEEAKKRKGIFFTILLMGVFILRWYLLGAGAVFPTFGRHLSGQLFSLK